MNLFERLLFRRLCNEQGADGGVANTAATGAASTSQSEQQSTSTSTLADNQQTQQQTQEQQQQSQEQQTQEKNPGDEQKKPGEQKDQKPEGAPEKYEFKAGKNGELDQEALKGFEPLARELNLTNEQAQKMVDLYGEKLLPQIQKQQTEAWQKTTEQWAADVKADKEIGGDKLVSSLSVAQRALDQFGTPELKEYLNATGLGNHPELVKAFVKIGKSMSEDGMVTGSKTTTQSVAQRMYPNMNP